MKRVDKYTDRSAVDYFLLFYLYLSSVIQSKQGYQKGAIVLVGWGLPYYLDIIQLVLIMQNLPNGLQFEMELIEDIFFDQSK